MFLNASIAGTITQNTVNPSRGRFWEVLSRTKGVLCIYVEIRMLKLIKMLKSDPKIMIFSHGYISS